MSFLYKDGKWAEGMNPPFERGHAPVCYGRRIACGDPLRGEANSNRWPALRAFHFSSRPPLANKFARLPE
jgi:hypothetical protein